MRRYLLIGGIGSGKSTVSALLIRHGVFHLDLDKVGHAQLTSPCVIEELVAAFGSSIVNAEGHIDRAALAKAAFSTAAGTERLNTITHPRIVADALQSLQRAQTEGYSVAIVEASAFDGPGGTLGPLLEGCDGVIAVVAPVDVRVARALKRGWSEADIRRRIDRQPTDAKRCQWANYVIHNGKDMANLEAQVNSLWASISGS